MAHFDSRTDRGYRLSIDINQVSDTQVRAKLILINGGARFQLWDVSATMVIDGQTFKYSGRPNLHSYNMRTTLIDKTVTVSKQIIAVSGSGTLPTGRYYLPSRRDFPIGQVNYTLPRWPNTRGLDANQWNYRGSSLTWDIPADSFGNKDGLNDYIWWRHIFWAGTFAQAGYFKITTSDAEGNFLYGLEVLKRDGSSKAEMNGLIGTDDGYRVAKSWTFVPSDKNSDNPNNKDRGWSDILREDDKITFYWFGSHFKVDAPELKGKVVTQLHATWQFVPGRAMLTHNYLDGITFTRKNAKGEEDVKNTFPDNSVVVIDSENELFTVNGVEKYNLVSKRFEFPEIPVGESELEIFLSKWIQSDPEITVEFEERYL